MSGLFKLTFDDSQFQRVFQNFEEKLNRHEEMIHELQRLLQQKPSRSELEKVKEDLRKEFTEKISQAQADITEQIDIRFLDFERKVKEQLNALSEISILSKRVGVNEEISETNRKSIADLQLHTQTIANCFGLLNNESALLDDTLQNTLQRSTILVKNNFNTIFDTLGKYKTDFDKVYIDLKNIKGEISENKEQISRLVDIDLSTINPQPEFNVSWTEKPILPDISKFDNIVQVVAYIYEMEPKLQGYLLSMHQRVLDNIEGIDNAMTKETLDRLLEKIRKAIRQMDDNLADLRNQIGKNLTRKEVQKMIEDVFKSDEVIEGTSVGAVRCIACGREMPQVNGALPESETIKKLGVPPNSLTLLNGGGGSTQMYSSLTTLKGGINETPRSIKSFHACKVTRRSTSKL